MEKRGVEEARTGEAYEEDLEKQAAKEKEAWYAAEFRELECTLAFSVVIFLVGFFVPMCKTYQILCWQAGLLCILTSILTLWRMERMI